MDELEDLYEYNGNTLHDMWINLSYQENTDKLPDIFDEDAVDDFINDINDCD